MGEESATNRALALFREFQRTGDLDRLNTAIGLLRQEVDTTPGGHPDRALVLSNLGAALYTRYTQLGQASDLAAAITLLQQAVAATPATGPSRAADLGNLVLALQARFERTGQPGDLDEVITFARQVVAAAAAGDPGRAGYLYTLGSALRARFGLTGQAEDLDGAITAHQQAVAAIPAGHPDRAASLSTLGGALHARFERTGDAGDLDGAITAHQQAVAAIPAGHPDRAALLSNLGAALQDRFGLTGRDGDLAEAIRLLQQAVGATPAGRPGRAVMLSNLRSALWARFERTGDAGDLDDAITAGRQAVAATPAGQPDRAMYLSNLALAHQARFELSGRAEDLDAAIAAGRQAVAATPAGHPNRAICLSNLGGPLLARFELTGRDEDLDDAITVGRQAAAATPAGHAGRATVLSTLGAALSARFERTGQASDLDDAIAVGQQAVAATPAGHFRRAVYLNNLALALRVQFELTGQASDLDAAITAAQQAVEATPPGHSRRAGYLSHLGFVLLSRFRLTGQARDLDAAITAAQEAVAATPTGHPGRAGYLSNLGLALLARFGHTGQARDLDAAITAAQEAVAATPTGHPGRAGYLSNLGNALQARSELARQADDRAAAARDLAAAIECWRAAAEVGTAPPGVRVAAARAWGRWAFQAGDEVSAADGHAAGVALLPQAAWQGLDRATQEEQLATWAGLAADAAACAIAAGQLHRAVEVLEQGRSVLWTQALQLRGDLTRLREHAPDLAGRLDEVRRALNRAVPDIAAGGHAAPDVAGPAAAREHAVADRRHLARQWDDLIARVRRLDGFEHFLQAIPFGQLQAAAAGGAVVIVNVSQLGCHALIVSGTGDPRVRQVPLPQLTYAETVDRANTLLGVLGRAGQTGRPFPQREADRHAIFDVLDWLWRVIAAPVLDALGHTGPPQAGRPWPRVWWCPTGPLTVLPLHAAGHHSRFTTVPVRREETVPGRVISSYTPTLTGLRRAREVPALSPGEVRQLVVGMPVTPGQNPLPAVPGELRVLAEYLPPPRQARHLVGEAATRAEVTRVLADYPWVHLACHAHQDQAHPAGSAFALWDGPLTIASLSTLRAGHPDLAFLSACQTAAGATQLLDEAIHLAAAMQLLGYRHVIATSWSIADAPTPELAKAVYTQLTRTGHGDAGQAAQALHDAVGALHDACPGEPLRWAPYLHLGA